MARRTALIATAAALTVTAALLAQIAKTPPAEPKTASTDTTATAASPNTMPGCGMGMGGRGMRMRNRVGMGHGGMGGGRGMQSDHVAIHALLAGHNSIKRTVMDIPNGVRTDTTSVDSEVASTIRAHVREMKARLERGQPIRMMDPLFREIFANAGKIQMKIEDIPGGARVTETSQDANVVLLIRQHARTLDQFVAEGMQRMHEPSALPDGYKPASR